MRGRPKSWIWRGRTTSSRTSTRTPTTAHRRPTWQPTIDEHTPPGRPRSETDAWRHGDPPITSAWLAGVSALLTALICGPLFGGYLLHRDAVAVPQFALTPAAFGIDGAPPRAVPQDGFLAAGSQWIDGGAMVATITAFALLAAGLGYGRLAQRVLPGTGTAGAVAAAIIATWNPWVAERLLQGQWSLLTGYAALGWIVRASLDLREDPARRRSWAILTGWLAVAGFTPTGSMLALIVVVVAALALRLSARQTLALAALWLITALPWLVGTAVSDGSSGHVGGAASFAARAETGLGTLGSVLGLGGIWNADAVPASRGFWWAAVATACFLLVVIGGAIAVRRTAPGLPLPARSLTKALGILALTAVALIALAATGPGLAVLEAALTHIPGAGLLRDTQKYLALTMPFVALAAAAAAGWLRTWVPTGFAVTGIALLVVAPLPDLAWGVGGKLRPIQYPDDYAAVTALVGRTERPGGVAVWPATPMRDYPWNNGPSLSPLPRMLDAPVVMGGQLRVDDDELDAPTQRTREVISVLKNGGDPPLLADLGVDLVVVENTAAPTLLAENAARIYAGPNLTVYRIGEGGASYPAPTTLAWVATGIAHSLWLLCLLAGPAAQLTSRKTRANSSAVAGQE
ncbi:MAG: hypothetical protein WAW85_06190 [Gordonia sp. (in: high G+C Gram-positive bacteria)]|uniref:hypothetical protein n=1 Tax=Gordonia sp. (in: high G+C Gram-positive bacteria) TaxID=84139 RepID=UPI003BB60CE5